MTDRHHVPRRALRDDDQPTLWQTIEALGLFLLLGAVFFVTWVVLR